MNIRQAFLASPFLIYLLSISPGAAAVPPWQWDVGAYGSTGDYGSDPETRIQMLPLALSYREGAWQYKVASGILRIAGPGNLVDGEVSTARASLTRTDTGVADTYLSTKYRFDRPHQFPLYLDLTGKLKLPTADEDKGLGTGKTDFEVQLGGLWWTGVISPYFSAAYRWRGTPEGNAVTNIARDSFRDTAASEIGAMYSPSHGHQLGASFSASQSALKNGVGRRELNAFYSAKLNPTNELTTYTTHGLSNGSPNWALGVQWTIRH